MIRNIIKIISAILILALLLVCADRMDVVKRGLAYAIGWSLGTRSDMDSIALETDESTLGIRGLRLYNPAGFPEGILLDAPEFYVKYALPLLVRKKYIHILQVTAHVEEIVVVKRADGRLNVDSLKGIENGNNIPQIGKSEFLKDKRVHVDVLTLSVDRVVYQDYTKGKTPDVQVYDVNIKNQNYRDIPGVRTLFLFMLSRAMTQTAIKGAAIYGLTAFTTVGFWPAGAAIIVMGKDSAKAVISDKSRETVFSAAEKILEGIGDIHFRNPEKGILRAQVKGSAVTVTVRPDNVPGATGKVSLVVSARQIILPMPSLARNVLWRITESLETK